MFEDKIQRAEVLIGQGKYKDAEKILSDLLSEDPNNAMVLGYYGIVCLNLNKSKKANELIKSAISLAPDYDFFYYVDAQIALNLDKYNEAEKSLIQAINLNPEDADYHALYALVKLDQKKFEEALKLANHALSLESDNITALNARASALTKLNDVDSASETIEGALKENPNDSYTHANYGWNLLERGDNDKALNHFKESLKINPNSSFAERGMVEALKSKYLIYRIFLKYTFWMSNLTQKYQWGVILGFYFGTRVLNAIANYNSTLRPFLTPLVILLGVIAYSTWLIGPLSNLAFRLNKYGKHMLNKNELISSNFVGFSLLVCICGFLGFFIMGEEYLLAFGVYGFAMMLPLGVMLKPTKFKYSLIIYTAVLSVVGLLAIFISFKQGGLINLVSTVFVFGFVAFQWIANFLIIKENNV